MPSNDDFWDNLTRTVFASDADLDMVGGYLTASEREEAAELRLVESAVEHRLKGKSVVEGSFESVRGLTDRDRAKQALALPVEAGVKVQFASNSGAVLTYEDPPAPGSTGTVVAVKSASGPITSHNGLVFARWDDGKVRGIHADHLRLAAGTVRRSTASTVNRIRVASLGDLSDFLRVAGTDSTLVHKATKDLWSVRRDGADYVIERLFDDTGSPVKV